MTQPTMMPLLFLYVALVSVLLTYVITRKLLLADRSKEDRRATCTVALGDEDVKDLPEEIARQLSLMIRYEPREAHGSNRGCRVQIEERLMLGGAPLTNWVKHEEDVEAGALDAHAIEQFSCLKLSPVKTSVSYPHV